MKEVRTILKVGIWKIEEHIENGTKRFWIEETCFSSELHIYYNGTWCVDSLKITNQKVKEWIDKFAVKEGFRQSFADMKCEPIIEVEVLDKKTNETDYLVCDIAIENNYLIASRDSVSTKEEKSKFVAMTKVKIDYDYTLDENLQELYESIQNDITNGNLFYLA